MLVSQFSFLPKEEKDLCPLLLHFVYAIIYIISIKSRPTCTSKARKYVNNGHAISSSDRNDITFHYDKRFADQ